MSDRAAKKQKQRLKREAKRSRHQKLATLSPYRKVEMFSNLHACYINSDWRTRGQAIGYVVRQMRDGSMTFMTFLIDLWCAGLKDIWAKFDLFSDEVNEYVKHTRENMGTSMTRVSLDEIKPLLAAGVRFARQNGFRLPADLQKCLAFVGEIDSTNADLTGFGYEGDPGKLYWMAPLSDLRKRLVGCTVEEFLAKPNVEYMAELGEDYFEEEDENARFDRLLAQFEEFADVGFDEITAWLESQGEAPSPDLLTGFKMIFAGTLLRFADKNNDVDMRDAATELVLDAVDRDVTQLESQSESLQLGKAQIKRWLETFKSHDEAMATLLAKVNEQTP